MGFVVNKKIKEFSFTDLANQLPISTLKPITPIDLYQGGPVNPANGFVLFPSDGYFYSDPHARVQGEIAISSSFGVLQDILDGEGPDKKIIAMGHCVWKRGELEWEIFNNEWLIVPGDPKLIFDTRFEDRWEQAKKASGINLGGYIPHIGLA